MRARATAPVSTKIRAVRNRIGTTLLCFSAVSAAAAAGHFSASRQMRVRQRGELHRSGIRHSWPPRSAAAPSSKSFTASEKRPSYTARSRETGRAERRAPGIHRAELLVRLGGLADEALSLLAEGQDAERTGLRLLQSCGSPARPQGTRRRNSTGPPDSTDTPGGWAGWHHLSHLLDGPAHVAQSRQAEARWLCAATSAGYRAISSPYSLTHC